MHRQWEKLMLELYHYGSCLSGEANCVNVSQAEIVICDNFCLDIGPSYFGFRVNKSSY